uniref:Secreted protein n=1 Tax=Plectus sambesii TaxID=2011161 RepID=A0A914WY64_9BILA
MLAASSFFALFAVARWGAGDDHATTTGPTAHQRPSVCLRSDPRARPADGSHVPSKGNVGANIAASSNRYRLDMSARTVYFIPSTAAAAAAYSKYQL